MKSNTQATLIAAAIGVGLSAPSLAQDMPSAVMAAPLLQMDDAGPQEFPVVQAGAGMPDPILAIGEGGMGPGGPNFVFAGAPAGGGFAGLDLSDDQYEKLFAVKRDAMAKMSAVHGDMVASELSLHDLLLKPTLDTAKIQAVQDHINQLHAAVSNARLQTIVSMMSVLTADQREQLRKQTIREFVNGGPMGMQRPRILMRHGVRQPMPHPPMHPPEHEGAGK